MKQHNHEHTCGCEHEHHHEHTCGCEHEHHHEHHHEHTCDCGCSHGHYNKRLMYYRIAFSVLLTVLGIFLNDWLAVASFFASYIIIGYSVILGSFKELFKHHILGENLLMTVASIGAFILGEYIEAVAVMLLYQIGEMLQSGAVEKSRSAISSLVSLKRETVNINGNEVAVEKVKKGDIFTVKPGELIGLDGKVVFGSCDTDTKALTGESLPVYVKEGDTVLSGTVNLNGVISVEASGKYCESTVAKILRLVEEAENKKSRAEGFIRRFAKIYTPVVFCLALTVAFALPLVLGEAFGKYIYAALVFLTVSCPCALVISVPLTYFAGIGGASKRGVLIKGANIMDALAKADTFVFDKTGTLTTGEFEISGVYPYETEKNRLLEIIGAAESMSKHPVAVAITAFCPKNEVPILSFKEIAGRGVEAVISEGTVVAGNKELMLDARIQLPTCKFEGCVVYVALNGKYIGALTAVAHIRPEAESALKHLRALNIQKTAMLTGDNEAGAMEVANALSVTEYKACLLPQQKVSAFEEIRGKSTAFVGDGINDAPVLAAADIGIAMGGIGSDTAINAADIVIMDDSLLKIPYAVKACRKTRRIVLQNVVLALLIKLAVMVLGVFGMMWLWLSIVADVGVCLLAILNALRALKIK